MTEMTPPAMPSPLEAFHAARSFLNARLIGRPDLVDRLMIALLTSGHVLIEGAPGLAKTRAIRLFAQCVSARFVRIQATPDLLPADLTGTTVFRPETGHFEFVQGPLFANVVLMDEVNRAPPKVQSALLEAMGEGQISAGGETRRLERPFLVAATQNPIEHEGTYPLPEAQLDRFLFFVTVPMPKEEEERAILDLALDESSAAPSLPHAFLSPGLLTDAQAQVRAVHVSAAIRDYVVRLVAATRGEGPGGAEAADIEHAASPRGSIGLAQASQAAAWLAGRDHVLPGDVRGLARDVLSGRIGLTYKARASGRTAGAVVDAIVAATPLT